MKYLSVCSGIEAVSVAWHPLGFEAVAFSEIEAFPSAVLADRWPSVPNLGDMTKFQQWPNYAIDLLVGGTPCQSFSVAGLRKGMADPRGNLALTFLAIAARYRPEWILWENVPGVLSDQGNAFGCFLAGLAELGYGWAYRVLDAQHFGVPQRRRRVFVVGHLGDWRRAAAVLVERHSLQGHHPPRREEGEKVAGSIRAGSGGGCRPGCHEAAAGQLIEWPAQIAPTLNAHFGDKQGLEDQHALHGAGLFVPDRVGALTAKGPTAKGPTAMGAPEVDAGHYIVTGIASCGTGKPTLRAKGGDCAGGSECLIAYSLRGEGLDASEDGTGRGTPLVPVAIQAGALRENPESGPDGAGVRHDGIAYTLEARAEVQAVCFDTTQITSKANRCNPKTGDPCHPLAAGAHAPAVAYQTSGNCGAWETGDQVAALTTGTDPNQRIVAFSSKDHGADAGEISPTLRSMGHDGSHANGGGQVAVAVCQNTGQGWWNDDPVAQTIRDASGGGASHSNVAVYSSAVRRLTPRECERLQGFPDDYTLITYRGKPAADGPRYKALGNSMAVPVLYWLGERLQQVHGACEDVSDARSPSSV